MSNEYKVRNGRGQMGAVISLLFFFEKQQGARQA